MDTGGGGGGGTAGEDMAGPDLAGNVGDLAGADMAAAPGDMAQPPIMLSHLPQHYLTDGTCDLTVNSTIDTGTRKVDGNDVPAGCMFVADSESGGVNVAVLVVRSLSIPSGTVTVTGPNGLVVVAATTINIAGVLDGSAKKAVPGPGGAAGSAGGGQGGDGNHTDPYSDSGGNGGSFGNAGAQGGMGTYMGADANPKPPSSPYGTNDLATAVPGGSGGGNGSSEACNGKKGGPAGAGGGSIQLSAGTSITIGGMINVGGGGGGGGCQPSATDQGSGGGGGSGGAIFLESRSVTVVGGLWANGGSGGGGGSGATNTGPGSDGNNATTTQTGATGGPSGGTFGGDGGPGGALNTMPGKGLDQANGGGGGGGVGRIVVRSRGAAGLASTAASPMPFLDPGA